MSLSHDREMVLEVLGTREATDGTGHLLDVLAVPYQRTISFNERGKTDSERFLPGSFRAYAKQNPPTKVYWRHDTRQMPLGKAVDWHERADGLYGSLLISSTQRGEEALTLVREGIVDSVSISFVDQSSQRAADGVIERRKAVLREISLVDSPAYVDAKVLAVRGESDVRTWFEWVESLRV